MANDQQNSNYGTWGPTDPQHNQWQPPQNEQSFRAQQFQAPQSAQSAEANQDFQANQQQWAPQASGNQPLPPEWQTDQTQQIPQPRQGWGDPQQGWGDPQQAWGEPQQAWSESSQPAQGWENSHFQQASQWGQQPSGQWDQQPASQWDQPSGQWDQPSGQWDQPSGQWDQSPAQQWGTTPPAQSPQQAGPSQPSMLGEFFTRLVDFNFTGLNASGFIKTLYVLVCAVAILGWIFGVLTLFQFGSLFAATAWLYLLFGWIGALTWIGLGRAFLELVVTQQAASEELRTVSENTRTIGEHAATISQHAATIGQNTTPAAATEDSEQSE